MKFPDTIAIIPARFSSTRLPGKLALKLDDRSILEHTYTTVKEMNLFAKVIIACDQDMYKHIDFPCEHQITSDSHPNGTCRIEEVARNFKDYTYVVNIQGDEPFIHKDAILALLETLHRPNTDIASLCAQIEDKELLHDFSVVKVVRDVEDRALYFSRQAIPAHRDRPFREWFDHSTYFRHIGLYGYKNSVLSRIVQNQEAYPMDVEMLEQLAWLYQGLTIRMTEVEMTAPGIDTQADLEWAQNYLKGNK